MEIKIIEVEPPMFSEFTMFANPDLELLKQSKTIRVSIRQKTKTRISTTMQFGQYCVRINFAVEGIKTHEESEYNMFSGERSTSNYFVKSAKQDLNVFKEYLKKVVEKVVVNIFKITLDEITVELESKKF